MEDQKVLEVKMYDTPIMGVSITDSRTEVIGERTVEVDGKVIEQYLYNIVGYTSKNGEPFISLKANIYID